MSVVAYPHIEITPQGVPILAGTTIKVVEAARATDSGPPRSTRMRTSRPSAVKSRKTGNSPSPQVVMKPHNVVPESGSVPDSVGDARTWLMTA